MFIHFVFVNRKELSSLTEEVNINAVLFSYVDNITQPKFCIGRAMK